MHASPEIREILIARKLKHWALLHALRNRQAFPAAFSIYEERGGQATGDFGLVIFVRDTAGSLLGPPIFK